MMALASSSSSSYSSTSEAKRYHVFLSFRGEDTRDNFTSHLLAALRRNNIATFIDDYLNRGDGISPSLLKAIEESKIAIIIFSKGYASSRWCLEELAKIIERKNSGDIIILPVFFHVDPSNVRNQTGTFGEAFVSHEKRFEQSLEKVQRWRTALTETTNVSGFDSNVHRREDALVNAIVKDVLKRLNDISPSYNKGLVGIKSSIAKIESLLNLELKDMIIVGIWGMGGIGKTTLAQAVFTKISSQFESKYFQRDIREESEKSGFAQLRKAFLSTILEDERATFECNFTIDRLHNKKILLVIDDVSCLIQREKLIGDVECFGPGSRIIITSRDQQVLKNFGVNRDKIYEVKALMDHDSLTLFSRCAFKLNYPDTGYEMISKRVSEFAKGNPLALKVLGGLLLDRTHAEWESALHDLERNPNPVIQDVLKISYNGLDVQGKNIFLDTACFFEGANKNFVMEILDVSEIKISILKDKSLVTIEDDRITMHDLLKKTGWEIVKQESKDPGKRSRLWQHDDICRVLRTNTGTEAIEGIRFDLSKLRKDMTLKRKAFLNMRKLKFFDICYSDPIFVNYFIDHFYCKCFKERPHPSHCQCCPCDVNIGNKVLAPKGLKFASPELRFFRWSGYPLESLPSNFDPENLIALILPLSNIKQLGKGFKYADKLKRINLMLSKHLVRIQDLSLTPNLESLNLEGCTSLIEVPSSIICLNKLVILNLKGCKSLSSLPTSILPESLTDVILSGCSNLKTAPQITRNMKRLFLDGTAIEELSVKEYSSRVVEFDLAVLELKHCSRLEGLPSSIFMFKSLKFLRLSGCSRLERLSNDLGNSEALEDFVAKDTAIREVPLSIEHLNKLPELSLAGLKDLVVPALPISPCLSYLDLSNCQITKLPDSLFQLSSLKYLGLRGNNFGCIPASIKNLSKLGFLDISYCERLQFLPMPPGEEIYVYAYNCTSLEEIDSSFLEHFESLNFPSSRIELGNCCKLDLKALKANMDKALREDSLKMYQILYPGNEIPEWFSIQNKAGSSLAFELPLDIMKTSFSGFVWCVVLTFQARYIRGGYDLRHKLIARDKDGKWEKQLNLPGGGFHYFDICDGRYCVTTDHVLMSGFDVDLGEMVKDLGNFDLHGVHVTIEFYFEEIMERYEIKKCGIKLLYKQDCIGEAVEESSISLSSHEETEEYEEDEEEERKEPNPKRPKF